MSGKTIYTFTKEAIDAALKEQAPAREAADRTERRRVLQEAKDNLSLMNRVSMFDALQVILQEMIRQMDERKE